MNRKDQFYSPEDNPDKHTRKKMWNEIRRQTYPQHRSFLMIADLKSFVYGIAAAIVLYFASVGVYTTVRQSMENAKPGVLRLDEAYQSAIEDFEKIIPNLATNAIGKELGDNYMDIRKEQIKKIDIAIANFKSEIGNGDLSPLAQKRLRQLYSMKLKVLQELFDQGELSL